jgi:hypothetical protein
MEKHIKQENILNFLEENLKPVESEGIKLHLKKCLTCSGEMEKYKKIIGLMKRDESFDASNEDIIWAKNLFITKPLEVKPTVLERVFAMLKMDLSTHQPEFGERSATTSSIRQMLYQTRDCSIDLRVSQKETGINLAGQILGENFEEIEVKLEGKEKTYVVKTNEISEFDFNNLKVGYYTLTIGNQNKEIIIENLDLR